MEVDILISIIMPVFNAEQYLNETISSIQKQSFKQFELICVDDGSTDDSLNILRDFERKYTNIQVIRNTCNMGAAFCRNYGLCRAIGEYVLFLDSDDYFSERMLELAYESAKKNDVDVCLIDYFEIKDDIVLEGSSLGITYKDRVFNYKDINYHYVAGFPTAPWNKLVRRDFIIGNQIKFQSLSNANDVVYSMMVLLLASRICVANEKALIYNRLHSSQHRISNNRKNINMYLVYIGLLQEARNRNFNNFQYEIVISEIINLLLLQFRCEEVDGQYYTFLKDEGIKNIEALCGFMWNKMNPQYTQVTKTIQNTEYNNNDLNYLDLNLKYLDNDIWHLWDEYKEVAIWGVGQYGKVLIQAALARGKKIVCVFDSTNRDLLTVDNYEIKVEKYSDKKIKRMNLVIIAIKYLPMEIVEMVQCDNPNIKIVHMKKRNAEYVFEKCNI